MEKKSKKYGLAGPQRYDITEKKIWEAHVCS